MTPLVCIPSKNRIGYTAGSYFPEHKLFVEPQDEAQYRRAHPDKDLVVLPENDRGFGYVCEQMNRYALENGHRYWLFVDDDIRKMKDRTKAPFDRRRFLSRASDILGRYDLAQLGVSFQGHNWHFKGDLKFDTACWCVVFNDAEKIAAAGGYDTDNILFNDYEITARLIRKGFRAANWYEYMVDHQMASMEGGANTFYKKKQFVLNEALKLARKYGHLCRPIFHEGHQLTEVRMRWAELRKEAERAGLRDPNDPKEITF
ncbi:MAG: hypothetical protein Q8Q08_13050 [Candidatus Omnitrophota bacterium]|nr:hypothetical protein [Candidatus Omnitrophota bacterium]